MFSINCQFKITNKFINAEKYLFIFLYQTTTITIANNIWKLIQNFIGHKNEDKHWFKW